MGDFFQYSCGMGVNFTVHQVTGVRQKKSTGENGTGIISQLDFICSTNMNEHHFISFNARNRMGQESFFWDWDRTGKIYETHRELQK